LWGWLDVRFLDEVLKRVVEKLKRRYKLHAVILFGSVARGDWGPWSDVDLLIVADFSEPYLSRLGELMELLEEFKTPIEPHPYRIDEVKEMLSRLNPLIIDALDEGKQIYVSKEFHEVLNQFKKLCEKGLRRSKTSIYINPTP